MTFSWWLRRTIVNYLWDKVAWVFFISILSWFLTLIVGNAVGLSGFLQPENWSPPEIIAIVDKIADILSVPALGFTILTGIPLLIKTMKNAVIQAFSE